MNRQQSAFNEPKKKPFIIATATGRDSSDRRFKLWRQTFYHALPVELERNKQYEIKGRIDGITEFRIRHVRSDKPYVFLTIKKENVRLLSLGNKYRIVIDSVKERTDFKAISVSGALLVKIPRAKMKEMGFASGISSKRVVVKFTLRNLSKPYEPEMRSFFTYTPDSTPAIHLNKTWASSGDILRLVDMKTYTIDDFLKDFEEYKGDSFSNVTLSDNEKGTGITVDGEHFQLSEPRLNSFGLKVILTATIEPTTKEIRFRFDGFRIDCRLFIDKRIRKMKGSKGELEIQYRSGPGDYRVFHVYLDRFGRDSVSDQLKLVSFPCNGTGHYIAEVTPKFAKYVRSRLASSSGTFRWSREKGDISEAIISSVLGLSGLWQEASYHPSNQRNWKLFESNKPGPDSVQRFLPNFELDYFESKWWERFLKEALRDARRQVLYYHAHNPYFEGQKVSGAFVAILRWDTRSTIMDTYIEKVS